MTEQDCQLTIAGLKQGQDLIRADRDLWRTRAFEAEDKIRDLEVEVGNLRLQLAQRQTPPEKAETSSDWRASKGVDIGDDVPF